jgi:hypothetical protein
LRLPLVAESHALVDRLTLAPPDDDAEHDESQNSRHDSDQCNVVHVSLLFAFTFTGALSNRNVSPWIAHLPKPPPSVRIIVITGGAQNHHHQRGKMKNTSGGTIFTLVLALISSARWRRFNRMSSENTRSDCAMLVPKRSVWISIATSALMSGKTGAFRQFSQRVETTLAYSHLHIHKLQFLAQHVMRNPHILGHPEQSLVEPQPSLDADHQKVQGRQGNALRS